MHVPAYELCKLLDAWPRNETHRYWFAILHDCVALQYLLDNAIRQEQKSARQSWPGSNSYIFYNIFFAHTIIYLFGDEVIQ